MGAYDFLSVMIGKYKDPSEAFRKAVDEARYHYGHGGYTGTIAEKGDFVMVEVPPRKDPYKYANDLVMDDKSVVYDKWGPAGCIELKGKWLKELRERHNLKGKRGIRAFIFFGWASS